MYSKNALDRTRMVLIAILFILPLPTQAQSLGMDVAILGEILNVLKEMRNDELKSIKNSETSPRNQHEEFLTTEQSKPIGEAENIKKLIEAAEGNAKETNKNIRVC